MKAFNSYLEGKLIDLKNSKIGREDCEKMGMYSSISERQRREEEFNILICNFVLSDSTVLKCYTFRELTQYLNSTTIVKFVADDNISVGYGYSYIASLWSQFNSGNDL